METCGKDIEDDEVRQAIKDCGIGTPATRAAIVETLFARGYVVCAEKSLVPTEKGLALYYVVKEMQIADVAMTGEWEQALECHYGRSVCPCRRTVRISYQGNQRNFACKWVGCH